MTNIIPVNGSNIPVVAKGSASKLDEKAFLRLN